MLDTLDLNIGNYSFHSFEQNWWILQQGGYFAARFHSCGIAESWALDPGLPETSLTVGLMHLICREEGVHTRHGTLASWLGRSNAGFDCASRCLLPLPIRCGEWRNSCKWNKFFFKNQILEKLIFFFLKINNNNKTFSVWHWKVDMFFSYIKEKVVQVFL